MAARTSVAARAPFVVLDGNPFKGLWYNRIYAEEGWEGVKVVAPLYRAQVEAGALAFPDLYVVLTAAEEQLRERRAGDPTRSRGNFEKHLSMAGPLLEYFHELRDVAPGRVAIVEPGRQEELVGHVVETLGWLLPGQPDSLRLFNHIVDWLRSHPISARN